MNSQWNIHKWYITQLSKIKDIQTLQSKPTMLSRDISHNYPFHYTNETISSMHQEPKAETPWEAPSPEAGYSGWTQLYTDPQHSNQQYEAVKQ